MGQGFLGLLWVFAGVFVTVALQGAEHPFRLRPVAVGASRTHLGAAVRVEGAAVCGVGAPGVLSEGPGWGSHRRGEILIPLLCCSSVKGRCQDFRPLNNATLPSVFR